MTITLTREEAQQVLDVMEGSIDAQEWEINDHITKYGEWFRPQRIESMKRQLADANSTIDLLRARLEQPEREWQGLTDDEIAQLMFKCEVIVTGPTQFNFARAIEAKLKEKNT
jgi:hypothetical protein